VSAGSMVKRGRLWFAVVLGGGAGIAMTVAFGGCVETEEQTVISCAPIEDFRPVSAVLEQRCGTLDCHGDGARPFKIYGRIGLRSTILPEAGVDADQYFSGGSEQTTDVELALNHRSLCGMEPEIMNAVLAGERPPGDLTLVRKPRLQERHKGGRIWDDGKPGDRCLTGWLLGDYEPGTFDPVNCTAELGL
jgi:hypothetical protein